MTFFEVLIQLVSLGCVNGLGYALSAIGLTLIFGVMKVINFAHGEFYMLGAFVAYTLVASLGIHYIPALGLTVVIVAAIGMLCERLSVAPLRDRSPLTLLLATLALSMILLNGAQMVWSATPRRIPSSMEEAYIILGPIYLTHQRVFIAIVAFIVIALLHLFLKRTTLGKLMRATAQDLDGAMLVGINVHRVHNLTFGIGCGMAALSGALVGATMMTYPYMGQQMVMKAFVVTILGGLGSVPGAILGGVFLGIVEALAGGFISIEYKDVFGFSLIIMVLLLKPSGLLGAGKA